MFVYQLFLLNILRNYKKKLNPLGANPTKWSNTLKQIVSKLPTNCLSVFDHFVKLALKELKDLYSPHYEDTILFRGLQCSY